MQYTVLHVQLCVYNCMFVTHTHLSSPNAIARSSTHPPHARRTRMHCLTRRQLCCPSGIRCMAYCMLVEVNTWLLIARRCIGGKFIELSFYFTWVSGAQRAGLRVPPCCLAAW